MKMKPLGDKIIVEVMQAEEVTKSGIIIPDTAKEKPQEAVVVSVGPGKVLKSGKIADMFFKKGDRVIFAKYSGSEISVDGKTYLIIEQDDVLAKVDK